MTAGPFLRRYSRTAIKQPVDNDRSVTAADSKTIHDRRRNKPFGGIDGRSGLRVEFDKFTLGFDVCPSYRGGCGLLMMAGSEWKIGMASGGLTDILLGRKGGR